MEETSIERNRQFLKDSVRKTIDFSQIDQHRGLPPPAVEKPFAAGAQRIDLVHPDRFSALGALDVLSVIQNRRSRRQYLPAALSFAELSFLLWATQGMRVGVQSSTAYRTVPSAGARHAFETYLFVQNVEGVEAGFYRFLPLEHQLLFEFHEEGAQKKIVRATFNQAFVGRGAAVFIWTAIPYRMEWRYGLAAHKTILLDAGHVCQNLYIACEAIGAGTCAVAAYDQELMDQLLRVDGNDEFVIYLAPVGKYKK